MAHKGIPIHRPKTKEDFYSLNRRLRERGFIPVLPGEVRNIQIGDGDSALKSGSDMAALLDCGEFSNGPLSRVAWSFDAKSTSPIPVKDEHGEDLGTGYIPWGSKDNIPSVIPALALSSPYTAAPLRYIADLTQGLGVELMYRFGENDYVPFGDAGARILATDTPDTEKLYKSWERTWYGYRDRTGEDPGAKVFAEENNLTLHMCGCMQDDSMLDIYFPTIGLQRGGNRRWKPKITRVDYLPAHSIRLEAMSSILGRYIHHVYFSDAWRTRGTNAVGLPPGSAVQLFPAAMPQHLLHEVRYIVDAHKDSLITDRPTWIVCPTFYPSGQRWYYPQPAWWSIFLIKAFDFSSTILYDKAKQRENKSGFGKIFYISIDYLEHVFSQESYVGNKEKQKQFVDDLDSSIEEFLSHRENQGKLMRQWMWDGGDGKTHHNVEVVDVADTTSDVVKAGKEELELSTSPIFLGLQVDPRLVGVPMVQSSNGGTAQREMHLLKMIQLSVKQRLYLEFMNMIPRFNEWDSHAVYVIKQQTLTTLDASHTGVKTVISGEEM